MGQKLFLSTREAMTGFFILSLQEAGAPVYGNILNLYLK